MERTILWDLASCWPLMLVRTTVQTSLMVLYGCTHTRTILWDLYTYYISTAQNTTENSGFRHCLSLLFCVPQYPRPGNAPGNTIIITQIFHECHRARPFATATTSHSKIAFLLFLLSQVHFSKGQVDNKCQTCKTATDRVALPAGCGNEWITVSNNTVCQYWYKNASTLQQQCNIINWQWWCTW